MADYFVIVDDEPSILKALKRELRGWADERSIEFQLCNSGEEAMEFLAAHYLDTVMLMSDQKMPGMKGHQLLASCAERYPDIILLMLTGYTDVNDIVKSIRAGIFSFILKPWDHDDLIYEVTKAYNVHAARQNSQRYLKLIREEVAVAEVLGTQLGAPQYAELGPHRLASHRITAGTATDQTDSDLHISFPLDGDRTLVVAGSISSDPVRATMVAATVTVALYRSLAQHTPDALANVSIEEVLATTRAALAPVFHAYPALMISWSVGIIEHGEPRVTVSGSSHPEWILVRETSFGEIEVDGAPFFQHSADGPAATRTVTLESGDVLAIPGAGLKARVLAAHPDVQFARELARIVRENMQGGDLQKAAMSVCQDLIAQRTGISGDCALSLIAIR